MVRIDAGQVGVQDRAVQHRVVQNTQADLDGRQRFAESLGSEYLGGALAELEQGRLQGDAGA